MEVDRNAPPDSKRGKISQFLIALGLFPIGVIHKESVLYLPSCCTDVAIVLDNDEAGMVATSELGEILKASKWNFHILHIEEGKDVNEWIQRKSQGLLTSVKKIIKEVTDYEEDSCRNSY